MSRFVDLLKDHRPLICDGAVGTELLSRTTAQTSVWTTLI